MGVLLLDVVSTLPGAMCCTSNLHDCACVCVFLCVPVSVCACVCVVLRKYLHLEYLRAPS